MSYNYIRFQIHGSLSQDILCLKSLKLSGLSIWIALEERTVSVTECTGQSKNTWLELKSPAFDLHGKMVLPNPFFLRSYLYLLRRNVSYTVRIIVNLLHNHTCWPIKLHPCHVCQIGMKSVFIPLITNYFCFLPQIL